MTFLKIYKLGQIGFTICGAREERVDRPVREDSKVIELCKYYTPEIHSASFVLPKMTKEALNEFIKKGKDFE